MMFIFLLSLPQDWHILSGSNKGHHTKNIFSPFFAILDSSFFFLLLKNFYVSNPEYTSSYRDKRRVNAGYFLHLQRTIILRRRQGVADSYFIWSFYDLYGRIIKKLRSCVLPNNDVRATIHRLILEVILWHILLQTSCLFL